MAISGIALIADRFLLPGDIPKPAEASATVVSVLSSMTSGPQLSIPELPFPHGIRSIEPDTRIADLFAPPHLDKTKDPTADNSNSRSDRSQDPTQLNSAEFEATHRLNGVLVNAHLKMANLDGQWIHIGTVIDGCTLMDVRGREAQFKCYDDDTVLHISGATSTP